MDLFYYPLDYPFPNVNRCFYNENPSKECIFIIIMIILINIGMNS